FERVALAAGPDSAVLTRELLYTGVTRARSGLALYADADTLRAGIARRTLRMTRFADTSRDAAGTCPLPHGPNLMPMHSFHPAPSDWFASTFAQPTPVQ